MGLMKRFITDEEGQGLVEYSLIIAFVSVMIIGALVTFRGDIVNVFTSIGGKLTSPS